MEELSIGNRKNELEQEKKRIEYFDIARGIAIILMIIGHVVDFGWKRNIIFSFHMPLFIIISGMFYREKNFKDFIVNIIKKLILPYIIVILITGFVKAIAIDNNIDIVLFLKNYIKQILYSYSYLKVKTNVQPIDVLWFFPFLAIIRVIFYILKKSCKEDDLLLGLFCLLISYFGYILGIKEKWLLFSADVAMTCMIFYYIGYIFFKYNILEKILQNKKLLCIVFLVWVLGIKFGSVELAVRNYPDGLFSFIVAICGTIITLKISMIIEHRTKIISKGLAWFGRNSMYILLIHYMERTLILYNNIFSNIANKKTLYKLIKIIIKMGIVTIGTIIINYISKFIIRMTKKDEKCRN